MPPLGRRVSDKNDVDKIDNIGKMRRARHHPRGGFQARAAIEHEEDSVATGAAQPARAGAAS